MGLERSLNPLSLRETVIHKYIEALQSIEVSLTAIKKTLSLISSIYGMRSGICRGHLGKICSHGGCDDLSGRVNSNNSIVQRRAPKSLDMSAVPSADSSSLPRLIHSSFS